MTKSLKEIAAAFDAFIGGRKLNLNDFDFDNLTILGGQAQPPIVELRVEEIREMLKEQKGRTTWD